MPRANRIHNQRVLWSRKYERNNRLRREAETKKISEAESIGVLSQALNEIKTKSGLFNHKIRE